MSNKVPSGHISFQVVGLDKLRRGIAALEKSLQDTSGVSAEIAEELANSSMRAFENQANPETGEHWKPWTASYTDYLKRIGKEDHNMLDFTHLLRESIQPLEEEGVAGIKAGNGSNLVYARIHQLGGGEKRKNYPARPYLGADQEARQDIAYTLNEFIDECIAKNIP